MTTHRNDPCACGSGKKTKKCCGSADAHTSRNRLFVITPIALIAIAGIYHGLSAPEEKAPAFAAASTVPAPAPASVPAADAAAPAAQPAAPGAPQAQPAGPAPAGKVWSAEHGHWHDAQGANASGIQVQMGDAAAAAGMSVQNQGGAIRVDTTPQPNADGTIHPQPEGPVPSGKVWSPEHGHWHDAGPMRPPEPVHLGMINNGRVFPRPEGEAPANGVWSAEHGHWHRADGSEMPQPRKP